MIDKVDKGDGREGETGFDVRPDGEAKGLKGINQLPSLSKCLLIRWCLPPFNQWGHQEAV